MTHSALTPMGRRLTAAGHQIKGQPVAGAPARPPFVRDAIIRAIGKAFDDVAGADTDPAHWRPMPGRG